MKHFSDKMRKILSRLQQKKIVVGFALFMVSGLTACLSETMMEPTTGSMMGSKLESEFGFSSGLMSSLAITRPDIVYAGIHEGDYKLQSIPYEKIPERFLRTIVPNETGQAPGTIVIDTKERFLYFTLDNGVAVRYGVGVGRAGFEWSGKGYVQFKRPWPRWTPPVEMIKRQPSLAKYRDGMAPGPQNPLGARALYIFQNGVDTGYRIHGSPEWYSIGQPMSSGCIRMLNQDIIDLYNRTAVGAQIIVL